MTSKRKLISVAVGILISVAALYKIALEIDFADMMDALRSFKWIWLLPSLFFFYLSMYLRAVRWGLFFRPHYDLSGARLFRPLMICFAFNSIFPLRVGEFVRAIYVGKKEKTGVPMAMATIVTERIFDGVTLLIFLAIALALRPIDPGMPPVEFWGATVEASMLGPLMTKIVIGCAILVAGLIAFSFPAVPRLIVRVIHAAPGLPHGLARSLAGIVEGVAKGFESVRGIKTVLQIIAYSIVLWALIALSNQMLAKGFPEVPVDFIEAMAIMSLIAVFIIIPAAPGYWGLFEVGVIFSLKVLRIQQDDSIGAAYAIVMHLVQFLPIVVIGLIFAVQDHIGIGKITPPDPGEDSGAET